ncbi:MAG TPA: hypothetical protein VGJ78_08480 [Vicinamibacterales bacterium]
MTSQAVLLGGLFIGVLSALPIVNIANCCCLWILLGGALTAYVAQEEDPRPIGPLDGARLGFRAGVFGAVVWLFASAAVDLMLRPLQQSAADLMLQNATDVPPDVRRFLEGVGSSASIAVRMVFGFLIQLFVAAPFASLGGLLGAAIVPRREQPQQP